MQLREDIQFEIILTQCSATGLIPCAGGKNNEEGGGMLRSIVSISAATVLVFGAAISTSSIAAKGRGGGKPSNDPPPACSDAFPSFTYFKSGKRGEVGALMLASADGCRSELLMAPNPNLRAYSMHLSEHGASGTSGVVVWSEEPGNNSQYVVRRLDFSVDSTGALSIGTPYTVLEQTGLQAEDQVLYLSPDVWGNADHSELYLVVNEILYPDTPNDSRALLIVDLDEPSQTLEISPSSWNCGEEIIYPQMVASCARPGAARWNASGTRLYLTDSDVNDWTVTIRVEVHRGATFSEWTLGSPELVYAGPRRLGNYVEPSAAFTQPASDPTTLPEPEYLTMSYLDRTGQHTVRKVILLDADDCVMKYALFSSGIIEPVTDPAGWLNCVHTDLYTAANNSWGDSWQSNEAFLHARLEKRKQSIYRYYAKGGLAQTSELLIENAERPDTSF